MRRGLRLGHKRKRRRTKAKRREKKKKKNKTTGVGRGGMTANEGQSSNRACDKGTKKKKKKGRKEGRTARSMQAAVVSADLLEGAPRAAYGPQQLLEARPVPTRPSRDQWYEPPLHVPLHISSLCVIYVISFGPRMLAADWLAPGHRGRPLRPRGLSRVPICMSSCRKRSAQNSGCEYLPGRSRRARRPSAGGTPCCTETQWPPKPPQPAPRRPPAPGARRA